jgi:hypothetical protein
MGGLVLWVCPILWLSREQQGSVFLDRSETICGPNVVFQRSCGSDRLGHSALIIQDPSTKEKKLMENGQAQDFQKILCL